MKTAATSAVFGGVILALMEGVGILFSRFNAAEHKPIKPAEPPAPIPKAAPKASSESDRATQWSSASNHYAA